MFVCVQDINDIIAKVIKKRKIKKPLVVIGSVGGEDTKQQLQQGHELFMFKQQHLRAVAWIEEKEAFLNNDDVGDSICSVEALLRKHKGFVSTTEKQAVVIEELERKREDLMKDNQHDTDAISNMMKTSKIRMEAVKEKSEQRQRKLEDSKDLHSFLRKVFDIKSWVKEKFQAALAGESLKLWTVTEEMIVIGDAKMTNYCLGET